MEERHAMKVTWVIGPGYGEYGPLNQIEASRSSMALMIANEMERHHHIRINLYGHSFREWYLIKAMIGDELKKCKDLTVIRTNGETVVCTPYATRAHRWHESDDWCSIRFVHPPSTLRDSSSDMRIIFR